MILILLTNPMSVIRVRVEGQSQGRGMVLVPMLCMTMMFSTLARIISTHIPIAVAVAPAPPLVIVHRLQRRSVVVHGHQ
jgi:hypothetical protein